LPVADPKRKVTEEIVSAADSAAHLTQQLLAFSRKQTLVPQLISLNQVVVNNEMLIRSAAGPDVRVELALAPGLPPTRVDPQQMQRALLNLVMNARDAMPQGGRLLIETAEYTAEQARSDPYPQLQAGRYAMLAVEDTGHGIAPQYRERVFEPFFSTKQGPGRGNGLGLSTVYGIITQSRGHVFLADKDGPGTRFEMLLPAAEAETIPAQVRAPRERLPALATILVVDDNPVVQRAILATLSPVGYEVLLAGTAAEALESSSAHPGAIDLLLTDVMLPNATGTDVARQIVGSRPETRVLFISGCNEDSALPLQLAEGRASFLKKPFRPTELMAAVRQALGSPAPAAWSDWTLQP
jgi:CheY-like chemotaxis protein